MIPSRRPPRVVLKYYCYKAASSTHLAGPIWVLFLLARDMSYAQVGLLDSIFAATLLVAEVPTGYLGDRIGRRNGLLVATALGSVGSVAFAFGRSFGVFAAIYAVLAVEQTFRSGTESAWLYEVLEARTDEGEFARVRGRGNAVGLVVGGAGMVAGGALGQVDLAYPWIVSGVTTGVAFVVLLTFPEAGAGAEAEAGEGHPGGEDGTGPGGDGGDGDEPLGVVEAVRTVRGRLLDPSLRSFVLFTALFYAVLGGVNYFVQPVSRGLGIPVGWLGVLYAGFLAVSAVVSYYGGAIEERVGVGRWFRVAPVAVGGAFVLVGATPLFALPAFFLFKAVRDVSDPIEGQYLNDEIRSAGRATVLSAVSMLHAVVAIPAQVAVGALADRTTPAVAIAVLGGVLLVGTAVAWLRGPPVGVRAGTAGPAD